MNKNILEHVSNMEVLRKSWKELVSGKSKHAKLTSIGVDGVSILTFEKDLENHLNDISHKIQNKSYKFSPLHGFLKKKTVKKDGLVKYRLITVATVSDRIVQRAILKIIKPFFQESINNGVSFSGSGEKKKKVGYLNAFNSLKDNIKKGKRCIYESDIKGFFDNINKDLLLEKILKKLPDDSLKELLRDIIYFSIHNRSEMESKVKLPEFNKGLSQGSPLSPLFANIFLIDFDNEMKTICGTSLIRYVDDFIICADTKDIAKTLGLTAEEKLKNIGLEIAIEKTDVYDLRDKSVSIDFLGLKITKFSILQKKNQREIISKIRNEYINFKYLYRKYRKPKRSEVVSIMNSKIRGFANYYQYFHTIPLMKSINRVINQKLKYRRYKGLLTVNDSGSKQILTENQWRELFEI